MVGFSKIVAAFAREHGIIAGICDATPLNPSRLLKNPAIPFVSQNIIKRTDPSAGLKGVKSVCAIGVGQAVSCEPQQEGAAQLSSLGVDDDYHIRVKLLLRKLVDELKKHGDFRRKILVDSPALDERAFAHRCGIGFFGRNGLLISAEFGTRFNIGLLLTDIPVEDVTVPRPQACLPGCRLCIDACPGGALQTDGLNAARCISYLTQKDELTDDEKSLMGRQLYGCDICQDICPLNAAHSGYYVNPEDLLEMDDAALAEKYGHTAMLWRGAKVLRRNAEVVINNGAL